MVEARPTGRAVSMAKRRVGVIGTDRWMSEPPCARQGVPHGQTESGGIVLAVICWAHAPRGGVTRQDVVLADLQSLFYCQ
jgi:hypothetical protein